MSDMNRKILFTLGRRRWRICADRLGDYMHRWYIFTPWFGLRVHKILRGDGDRHMHDHPFHFWSFILFGTYIEHLPASQNPLRIQPTRQRTFRPGMVNAHRAEDVHLLELPAGPVWTFVVTSAYKREWGFETEIGWVHNKEYEDYKRLVQQ